MKKIQVLNTNRKVLFEGTFQQYKNYISTHNTGEYSTRIIKK